MARLLPSIILSLLLLVAPAGAQAAQVFGVDSAISEVGSAVSGADGSVPADTSQPDGLADVQTADDADDAAEENAPEVLSVILPTGLDFTIDPLEVARRGQIYSEDHTIENRGNTDVVISFSDIRLLFANDTDFEAVPAPEAVYHSGLKSIYMVLDFGRPDVSPLVLTGPELPETVTLTLKAAGSEQASCRLSLTGAVNEYPAEEWVDGDVKIQLSYQLELVPSPKAKRTAQAKALPPDASDTSDSIAEDSSVIPDPSTDDSSTSLPPADSSAQPETPASDASATAEPPAESSEANDPPAESGESPEPPVDSAPDDQSERSVPESSPAGEGTAPEVAETPEDSSLTDDVRTTSMTQPNTE